MHCSGVEFLVADLCLEVQSGMCTNVSHAFPVHVRSGLRRTLRVLLTRSLSHRSIILSTAL